MTDPICLVLDAEEAETIASALEDALAAAPEEHIPTADLALTLRRVQEAITQTGPSFDPTAQHSGTRPAARTGAIDDASTPRPAREPSPPSPGTTAAARNTAAVPPMTNLALAGLLSSPSHWARSLARRLRAEREAHNEVVLSLGGLLAKAVAEADELRAELDALAHRPADGPEG